MRISDWSSDVCSSDLSQENEKPARFITRRAFFLSLSRLYSAPWQCLYLRPDPHGHGALRLTRPSHAAGSDPNGASGRAVCIGGNCVVTMPSVPPSISTVSSLAVDGSKWLVMKSGRSGKGGERTRRVEGKSGGGGG